MEKSCSRFYPNKCSSGKHLLNDRISSLPSEVLLIVLSFLPLKEMVMTSILSTRWLNLWVNTSVLDFELDISGYNNTPRYHVNGLESVGFYQTLRSYFVKWVDHVLKQHKGLYLKKFRIFCNMRCDYREDIDRWLDFALARKVELLELDFSFAGDSWNLAHNYVLNDSWFKSGKTQLDGSKSRVLQSNAKFLKSLSLKNANVTSKAINFFLRNCPFLERLELVGSASLANLVISDPTLVLKYLQIRDCRLCEFLTISNFNLVSLDTTVVNLILTDLPMLVELSIVGWMAGFENVLWDTLSQNATCLRQLESLKLCTNRKQAITAVSSILAQMTKLKRLAIDYIDCVDEPMLVFLCVMEQCNHLEEFVLELRSMVGGRSLHLNSIDPERKNLGKLNGLGSLSLKLFEFKGYNGCSSDFELIMNLVMNAPLIEKIIIDGNDMEKRDMEYPVGNARRLALKQIEDLREIKLIPPHVIVLIR